MTDEQILFKAYNDVFSGPQGELVMADLIRFCCFLNTTETQGYPDMIHFYEGRRTVFAHILDRRGKSDTFELAKAIDRMKAEEPPTRQEVADE